MRKTSALYLIDIIGAIEIVRNELQTSSEEQFKADRRQQWVVERGLEIISEASRRVPAEAKANHPDIPWPKIAAIGNVLRHEYRGVAPEIIWRVVRDDLPDLERVCRQELAVELERDKQSGP
jgi:uncharacterized protein with HEPN domain